MPEKSLLAAKLYKNSVSVVILLALGKMAFSVPFHSGYWGKPVIQHHWIETENNLYLKYYVPWCRGNTDVCVNLLKFWVRICMMQGPISLEFGEQQVCICGGGEGDMPWLLSVTCKIIFENSNFQTAKFNILQSWALWNSQVGLFSSLFVTENNVHLASIAFVCPSVFISVSGSLRF